MLLCTTDSLLCNKQMSFCSFAHVGCLISSPPISHPSSICGALQRGFKLGGDKCEPPHWLHCTTSPLTVWPVTRCHTVAKTGTVAPNDKYPEVHVAFLQHACVSNNSTEVVLGFKILSSKRKHHVNRCYTFYFSMLNWSSGSLVVVPAPMQQHSKH